MFPYGITTFCDDIRHEVQNKLTLVGCYGPELLVGANPPVAIPKLGVFVQARFPPEKISTIKLMVYVPKHDDPFFVHEQPEESNDFTPHPPDPSVPPLIEDGVEVAKLRAFVLPILLGPLVLEGPGYIKVRMVYRTETIRLGSLRIVFQGPESATPPRS